MIRQLRRYFRRALRYLSPTGRLSDQTVKSGVWVALVNVIDRVLQLLMVVVVARLIGPGEFGIMGIALLTLSALKRVTDVGIDTALIQHKDENVDQYLNTAWCLQTARGVLIAAVAYVAAPWAAGALGEPRAGLVIQVITLGMVLQGLTNPGVMYLQKNLEFHKEFVYNLSGRIVYVAIAIPYAYVYQSVWALVIGYLANRVTTLAVSYLISDYRPRPVFEAAFARELLDYGKWIFGSSVLTFLVNEGDDAFVSWFLGASSLGLYQLAYRLSNAPATEITHTISRVVFPTYSKLQDDVDTLREGYLSTLTLITFISIPAGVGIVFALPPFVEAFLGEEWRPMILPGQILAAYGVLHSFRTAAVPLFRAVGHPDYDTKIRALKLAFVVAFIYPAAEAYGLAGVSLVIVGNSLVANPVTQFLAMRLVEGRLRELVPVFAYPAVGSAVMAAAIVAVQRSVVFPWSLLEFATVVVVGMAVYAGGMLLVDRHSSYDIRSVLNRIRTAFA